MTLLVRDEEDCIASNIEYHLHQGVDFIIATDNLSEDNTSKILKYYQHQGVLHYIYESKDDYSQSQWVTRMAEMASTVYNADWIINSDADEFWWPIGNNTLKEYLNSLPLEIDGIRVKRSNFIPRQRGRNHYFIDTMDIRERNSLNTLGRPLPPKVCHRAYADINVLQGNHVVLREKCPMVTRDVDDIIIFHYPIRTYKQFKNKIKKGGNAYKNNSELPVNVGDAWRSLYEKYCKGLLRAFYDEQILDEDIIRQRLISCELVRDDRLRDFFKAKIKTLPTVY